MANIGTAVSSFDTYDAPNATLGSGPIGSHGGAFLLYYNATNNGAFVQATMYHEHATPGERVYSTFIPYP